MIKHTLTIFIVAYTACCFAGRDRFYENNRKRDYAHSSWRHKKQAQALDEKIQQQQVKLAHKKNSKKVGTFIDEQSSLDNNSARSVAFLLRLNAIVDRNTQNNQDLQYY